MRQKINKFSIIVFITIIFSFSLFGPNAGQIVYAGENQYAAVNTIAHEKQRLKLQAKQRIKAGETIPPRVHDPGYPVANCILPDNFPAKRGFVSFDTGFLGKIQYICLNKKEGKAIVTWRTWYCEGSNKRKACILGKWLNGEPTFKGMLAGTHETGLGNITFYFKKCDIEDNIR